VISQPHSSGGLPHPALSTGEDELEIRPCIEQFT